MSRARYSLRVHPPVHPGVDRVNTDDGSATLVQIETGWTYRSTFGARHESRTVFIEGGGLLHAGSTVRVLEFGFGAATNFVETVNALRVVGGVTLEYCAIDHAPVAPEDLHALGGGAHALAARATHHGTASEEGVVLEVHRTAFDAFSDPRRFDVIYFDPFGPAEQPESWSEDVFRVAFRHASSEARLVTYSAAGWVRRNMAKAGFFVATVPGAGRKREFTIASAQPDRLRPYPIRNRPETA